MVLDLSTNTFTKNCFDSMKIHKIRPVGSGKNDVLNTTDQPLTIKVFNENVEKQMTFSRVGRVLHGIEIPRDLFSLYKLGENELGIKPNGDPKISSGRLTEKLPKGKDGLTHNCIIVSFGEGQEYAVFCIHQTQNREIYDLYESIREASRKAVANQKVLE